MKEILLPYVFICWLLVKFGVIQWTVANAVKMIGLGGLIAVVLFTASRFYAPMDLTDSTTVKAPHATLSAVVGQQVDKVHVEHNQLVKKGDLLYTLRNEKVESQLLQLGSQQKVIGSQIEIVEHQMKAKILVLDNDTKNLERLIGMKQYAKQSDIDNASTKVLAGQAEVEALSAQTSTYVAQLAALDAQLIALDYANERNHITAPFDGQIGIVDVSEGSINGNIHLYDTSKKYLEMRIPDQAYAYIEQGQFAEFYVDAYPGETFRGRVHSIRSGTGEAFKSPFTQEQHIRQHVGNNMGSHGRTVIIEFDESLNNDKVLPIGATGSGWISANKPHSMLGFVDVIGGATVRLKSMKSYLSAM